MGHKPVEEFDEAFEAVVLAYRSNVFDAITKMDAEFNNLRRLAVKRGHDVMVIETLIAFHRARMN